MQGVDISSVGNSVLANVIYAILYGLLAILVIGGRWIFRYMSRNYTAGALRKLAFVQLVFTGIFLVLVPGISKLYFATFCILIFASQMYLLRGFAQTGISDAYLKTIDGIDFKSSLRLARTSISFLGIGAHKLTQLPEFRDAIERCAQAGSTARFLLSPPDNNLLETLARRNGVDPNAYKENVTRSLQALAKLKRDGFNIEVRHYRAQHERDHQQFRLFIIDEKTCLVSWTVWNKNVGADNPQLVLRRLPADGKKKSMAEAFIAYFDNIWEDSSSVEVDLGHYQ